MTNSKEYQRQYRATHRAQFRTYRQAWRAAHPLFVVWDGMMRRCGLHKGASAEVLANYAGRGITVCQEWRKSYKPFEDWALANGWKPGLELDRINNNGNYCPENCRFVSSTQNIRNRRNTVLAAGIPLATWYDAYIVKMNELGLSYNTVRYRFTRLGWTLEESLFTPPVKSAKPHDTQDLPEDWYEEMELSAVQYYSDQFSK